jgi:hypothetical protein
MIVFPSKRSVTRAEGARKPAGGTGVPRKVGPRVPKGLQTAASVMVELAFAKVLFRPIAVTRTKSKLFDNQKWGSALMVFAKSFFCGFWVTIRNIANPSQEKMNVIMNQPNVAPP